MSIKVETTALVTYTCELSDSQEEIILKWIADNAEALEYMTSEEAIIHAVTELYDNGKLQLYSDSVESDFSTESIQWSEFEERSGDDIINRRYDTDSD